MDHLMLVDSVTSVPKDCEPQLAPAGGVLLEISAAAACNELLKAALADGVAIAVLSGYRTGEYQRLLWNKSVHDYMSEGLSFDEAERLTGRYLASPCHSEHETGLACDFTTWGCTDTRDDLASTPEGIWLCRNAARFGFILRYPRMKEHITGIAYEPWHYRYVGLPHSRVIRERGLTLEEYLHYREERSPCAFSAENDALKK
ncbi:MAG: M15 family metallopeptidase [Ruminococcus sp.]|nr:M15 family metallopeptidase [Ruminococcus sp.]